MVHGIVKSYGGDITCDSLLNEGTVFNITLPTVEDPSLQENVYDVPAQAGNEHILLIDDEEMLIELGQTMLELLGYQVTARRSSLDALSTFQDQPNAFDLVITDQTMPFMNGIDLAQRIMQIRPEIPIILCTGYSKIVTEEKAKSMGIKGFAMKPLTLKALAELVRTILDENNKQVND
jgi:DNA-binding NtrC family response regulator